MIATELKLMATVGLLAGAFGVGWYVQGQRLGLQLEQLQHAATTSQLGSATRAVEKLIANQEGLSNALAQFQKTQQSNAKSQEALGALLRDMRGTAAGLRGDFADLPGRINAANAATLGEYASTCTAVFEAMAAAGGRLAESGADLARAAEGHAADEQMIRDARLR